MIKRLKYQKRNGVFHVLITRCTSLGLRVCVSSHGGFNRYITVRVYDVTPR